jgi:hypothetical protein
MATFTEKRERGRLFGSAVSDFSASTMLVYLVLIPVVTVECILLDHRAFAVPRNGYRNPKYPFSTKFFTLIDFEFRGLGLLKYFAGRRWTAREIIADLEGRRQKGEVWNT